MSRAAIGPAAVLALLAGFAIAGASVELLTHDVSYYLYVSREVLAGALPYTDYIDPNLPTIIYLGVPLAWLAGVFEVPVWSLFQGFVVLLEVVSVGLCAWLLRTRSLSDDDEAFWAVLATASFALCLAPMGLAYVDSSHFGQREHLALLLVAPYVLWHATRAAGETLPRAAVLVVTCLAALGLAIKPHFFVFWALLELWAGWRERGRWPRVALVPPLAFVLYFAVLLAALPDFPRMIRNTWLLYGAYRDRTLLEVLRLAPVALSLAILLLHRLVPVSPGLRPLRSALAVATLGWWIVGLMQLRGFPYHFAPAVSFSLLLAGVTLVGTGVGRHAIPLLYALLVYLGFASLEMAWRDGFGQDAALTRMLRERARGEPVVVLSTNVWPGFPAALYADTRWASRFPALWFLPGLYEGVPRAAPFAYRTPEQMGPLERWHLDAVVEDFAAQPPRVVLVDRSPVQPGFGPTNFDYLVYLGQDPRFRRLWCPFRKRERWERNFVVYERDPARADACESGGGGERPASR